MERDRNFQKMRKYTNLHQMGVESKQTLGQGKEE